MLRCLKNDRIRAYYEQLYPQIYSILCVIIYFLLFKDCREYNFDNILNAVISFVSIMIGFIGALVTLIFSLLDTKIIQIIFGNEGYRTRLKNFFLCSCQSGFFILGLSIIFFVRQDIFSVIKRITPYEASVFFIEGFKSIWVYCLAYFILSSYRIISLMIRIVFEAPEPKKNDKKSVDLQIQNLRKKHEK